MTRLRHLGRTHALLAGLLLACALVMRLALPAGLMPVSAGGQITLALCTAASSHAGPASITIDLPAKAASDAPDGADDGPCPFAASAAPALADGEGPDLAAPALLFAEFALPPPAVPAPPRLAFLTPPLRGPPLPA
ncbi:hypothetical protein PK98_01995 [Croceibacterium mercuriale]|uniref:DUF2946 domain-containing protein n=1 Tax=Croceibacterium mercuriale TaxID=1572751 RepID=A0A0B2BZN2_9SPHN|nr:hypothetical protein [Croceibacterium mercuriale]KHL25487.1 hypothetical protein PK98_01995 [Croceibacterium mercuriale]